MLLLLLDLGAGLAMHAGILWGTMDGKKEGESKSVSVQATGALNLDTPNLAMQLPQPAAQNIT